MLIGRAGLKVLGTRIGVFHFTLGFLSIYANVVAGMKGQKIRSDAVVSRVAMKISGKSARIRCCIYAGLYHCFR